MKKLFVIILNLIIFFISSCTVQNDTRLPVETSAETENKKIDSTGNINKRDAKEIPAIRTSPDAKVKSIRVPKRPD